MCVRAPSRCWYLVHLVCGAVLADSDRDGGLVRQGYPQLYIRHSIVVLKGESVQGSTSCKRADTSLLTSLFEKQQTQRD